MPESTVWEGSPSRWQNTFSYLFGLLLIAAGIVGLLGVGPLRQYVPDRLNVGNASIPAQAAFAIPIVIGLLIILVAAIRRRSRRYQLTTERIIVRTGIFSRKTEAIELYRVRDIEVLQPFSLRLAGLQTIRLVNTDSLNPTIIIPDVPARLNLADTIRRYVEDCRVAKRVRDVDVDVDRPVV